MSQIAQLAGWRQTEARRIDVVNVGRGEMPGPSHVIVRRITINRIIVAADRHAINQGRAVGAVVWTIGRVRRTILKSRNEPVSDIERQPGVIVENRSDLPSLNKAVPVEWQYV